MLDYMSDFPKPSDTTCKRDILHYSVCKYKYEYNISEIYLQNICQKTWDSCGMNFQGSYAGWSVYGIKECQKDIDTRISDFIKKRKKFYAVIKSLIAFNTLYYFILEKRYKPGGAGMIEAQDNFTLHV